MDAVSACCDATPLFHELLACLLRSGSETYVGLNFGAGTMDVNTSGVLYNQQLTGYKAALEPSVGEQARFLASTVCVRITVYSSQFSHCNTR